MIKLDDAGDGRSAFESPDPHAFVPPTSGTASNGLPIYSWDQAATQLTRESSGWVFTPGPVTVSYAFRSSIAEAAMPDDASIFSRFSAVQIAAAERALQLWSDVANIVFQRVLSTTPGSEAYSNNAAILFANYSAGVAGASAFAYYPYPTHTGAQYEEGDVWVNITLSENTSPLNGTFGQQVLAHEIGHAIGLSHPGNYDGGSPSYPANATYWQDARMFTVMSYFGSSGTGGSLNAFAGGPQLHDIAAAQLLYGANLSTRTGDTTYGFNSNTGLEHYTITPGNTSPAFSIWDAGGNDTIDFSGYATATEIDLREEAFSSGGPGNGGAGVAVGNISIARGAVIENAIGGSGADIIHGNAIANMLRGNNGADILNGYAGADSLEGGAGADQLFGGAGLDTANYALASTSASWVRAPSGVWTVNAGGLGADQLSSMEVAHFTDRDVFLDLAQQTFSGDGTSDVLWRRSDGLVATWSMAGSVHNGSVVAGSVGLDWTIRGTGDFSGDGRDDILWVRDDGVVFAWDDASSAGGQNIGAAGGAWRVQGVGDFNGDTQDDLLWRNDASGQVAIWTMNDFGVASQAVISGVGAQWTIRATADFDGDGRDDLLWRRADGQVYLWETNGSALTSSAFAGAVGNEWNTVGVGDFNGDGRADILWQRNDGVMAIWHMDGATRLSSGVIGGVGLTWHVADVGDYSGDGRDDILWRSDSNLIAVWVMNGFTTEATGITGTVPTGWELI